MQGQTTSRLMQTLAGGLGAGLLWWVVDAGERGTIHDYVALTLSALILTLFGAQLAMAGPLGFWRALPRATVLALVAAVLVGLTRLRFADVEQFLETPLPSLAGLAVATLPVPFLVAAARSRWNDYPVLFLEAWSIALRLVAALTFTGLVWLVILLSDQVLQIVGIDVIERLIDHEVVVLTLSGAAIGFGVAVIHDFADVASPQILLRLFRLFLPVVLGVMVLFLLALPFRGIEGLTGGLSPALLMLVLVGAGVSLISIVIDQSDDQAATHPLLRHTAQGMALVLPVFAALALWALWLRIGQHGWSPGRVFVALVGVVGLGYGLVYALAVLRGPGWMERIRQGNIRVILAVIALAALWQTPILNAERISAQNQLARYLDGRTPVEALDPWAIGRWGKPGQEALTALNALAQEPGHEALAARLAGDATQPATDRAALSADLAKVMPVQPLTATGTRDTLLPALEEYQLQDWLQVCSRPGADELPPCLMVVADLMPATPGEEALVLLDRGAGYVEIAGLYLDDLGRVRYRPVTHPDGRVIEPAEARQLLQDYRAAPPPLSPALLNQLGTGAEGVVLLP